MSIADAAQRSRALDVTRSFCVTAPAGSGKTELLIQRFLALLARVERPEQVLAITFTRKAAAEMLERVLQALWAAQAGEAVTGEHQARTRQLAEAALAHARERGWELARDVGRFNIRTIDGFCAALARQMPILSGFGGHAGPVDDAGYLYRGAVRELYGMVGSNLPQAADLDALLLHFDNNWDRVEALLVGMLGKREQWQDYARARHTPEASEAQLRKVVRLLVEEELEGAEDALAPWLAQLFAHNAYACGNRGEAASAAVPAPTADNLETWRCLKPLLLTGKGTLRKTVTVREGFPASSAAEKDRKAAFLALLQEIAEEVPDIEQRVARLAWLPCMDDHAEAWQLVLRLTHVLPLLSACLLLEFEREGAVDHTQVALSALEALGEDDAPTELALRLDYAIEHILVDEFQDTAINQYLLVERLTRGWDQHNAANPAAPRTLFIVGDGMQSIYGFRNANVGLFLRARQNGFNGIVPESLALQCNFRSEEGVVEWVNRTFAEAFPPWDDPRRGCVRFTPATAVRPPGAGNAVEAHTFIGEDAPRQEAQWLAAQIEQGLQDPELASIAVLGRSRPQLGPLVAELRRRGIPFAAQDMDPLSRSPAIVDLLTLCRALANPADRVAWLALLRAPWCGLSLADLASLGEGEARLRSQNLAALLLRGDLPGSLSESGRLRLQRVRQCLQWAWSRRDRLSLRVWVEQLWLSLGGPASLPDAAQLDDAEHFFKLLQQAEREGFGLDIAWMEQKIDRLYASGGAPDAKLQLMTLHKAKGLEFDWVLIPALARTPRSDDRQLLLWDEYTSASGQGGFLLAADDHSEADTPGLYNYLKRQRAEKSRNESARLLYVGATRAARRLTLSASLKTGGEDDAQPRPPGESTLLHHIWPAFAREMELHLPEDLPAEEAVLGKPLRVVANPPAAPELPEEPDAPNVPDPVRNAVERHTGSVIHLLLERLSLAGGLPETVPPALAALAGHALAQQGLAGETLSRARDTVIEAVAGTLSDERGRWLLDAGHPEAHSELPLTCVCDDKLRDIVIDRTFVDRASGERWVVDYKSSVPRPGLPMEAFLAEEGERYGEQLGTYRDALSALGEQPVRCALYFTRLGLLHRLPALDIGQASEIRGKDE